MSDCENCALAEGRSDGRLNQLVRLWIHGSSGLIQQQDSGVSQQSPGQTHKLSLAYTVTNIWRDFENCVKLNTDVVNTIIFHTGAALQNVAWIEICLNTAKSKHEHFKQFLKRLLLLHV